MSIEIITGKDRSAFYDTVTGIAFGPTFEFSDLAEDYWEWLQENGPSAQGMPQTWPGELHHELYDRWFSARVDPETGLLKETVEHLRAAHSPRRP